MNRAEAKREAHGAVAAFLDANCFPESDLFADTEEYDEADLDRFEAAIQEIIEEHRRKGPG